MKMIPVAVAGVGVLALVLAIVERLFAFQVHGVAPSGYLRFAETLFVLALVLMCCAKGCCCCKDDCCKEDSKPQP